MFEGSEWPQYNKDASARVTKAYKGNLKLDQEIKLSGGPHNCRFGFFDAAVGEEFLFYLSDASPGALYVVPYCGRSELVSHATEDLLYLNNLDKLQGKTRISGKVLFENSVQSGLRLEVRGKGIRRLLETDANGIYEIYDLPLGRYKIIPKVPTGWEIDRWNFEDQLDFLGIQNGIWEKKIGRKIETILNEEGRHRSIEIRFRKTGPPSHR